MKEKCTIRGRHTDGKKLFLRRQDKWVHNCVFREKNIYQRIKQGI
jgi:hypothetical protein